MSFSQPATRDSNLVLPVKTARLVIKDLILGDAAKGELILTQELLKNTENKVAVQSYIIDEYKIKEVNYNNIIANYDKQIILYKNTTTNLQKELKQTKRKLFLHKVGSFAIMGTLTYLIIK